MIGTLPTLVMEWVYRLLWLWLLAAAVGAVGLPTEVAVFGTLIPLMLKPGPILVTGWPFCRTDPASAKGPGPAATVLLVPRTANPAVLLPALTPALTWFPLPPKV